MLPRPSSLLTVRACKYDGTEHRRWAGQVVRQEGSLLVLDGIFDQEIQHDLLGTIKKGTTSTEYYWLDRWYNIFRFAEPTGEFRSYYCNINVPPTFDGQVLSYIDLDIDILVAENFDYRVVDQEDFERNAAHFGYSIEVRENAEQALTELIALIETRGFPFDQSYSRLPAC
jgi:protein associated with RNAse G/E